MEAGATVAFGAVGILAASGDAAGIDLALILAVGVCALWLGERIGVPAIILLLAAGVTLGPVTGLIDPDDLLGDLLFPVISAGVAVLLFEGGFELRWARLVEGRRPVLRLVTVGVVITWLAGTGAVLALFDVSVGLALLIGAILTVSGPTVVLPLLRQAGLSEPVKGILTWEGILIDPVGAVLAITVLEALTLDSSPVVGILLTVLTGLAVGSVVAGGLMVALREHWISDHLQVPVVLTAVIVANASASALRPEAGLIAATVLGIVLANQRWAPVGHIGQFNQQLGQVVLGVLFIILGARVDLDQLADVLLPALGVVAVLLVTRVVVGFVVSIGTDLRTAERAYLGAMAPRGIVAAAVASLFAIELDDAGRQAEPVVPLTFLVIVFTVVIYGLTSKPLARVLGVARKPPRGLAFVGAPAWARDAASALGREGVHTMVVTTDSDEVEAATDQGLGVYAGKPEELGDAIDTLGVREAIITSGAEELNALAVERFSIELGRPHVYLLPRTDADTGVRAGADRTSWGRRPFAPSATQELIEDAYADGAEIVVRTYDGSEPPVDDDHLVLFVVRQDDGEPVEVARAGATDEPEPGDRLVCLAPVATMDDLLADAGEDVMHTAAHETDEAPLI